MEPKGSQFESRLNLKDLSFINKSQLLGTPEPVVAKKNKSKHVVDEKMDATTKENNKLEVVVDGQAKLDLIKQSQFFKLVNNGSNRSNCNNFFLVICSQYNVENDTFQIGGESLRITLEDVAYLLGLKSEGSKPAAKPKSNEWDPFIEDVCTQYTKIGSKKDERLEKKNIQNILRKMKVSDEKERLQFRKLFSFYMVSFIVYPTSGFQASLSNFVHVQDLDAFEKVNWAQEILNRLQNWVKSYKNGNGKRYISCFMLLLEAWFNWKTRPVTDENTEESEEAAPISKFLGKFYSSRKQNKKLLNIPVEPGYEAKEKKLELKETQKEKTPSKLIEYHSNALLEAYSEKLIKRAILAEKTLITGLGLPYDEDVFVLKLKLKHCGSANASCTDLVEAFEINLGLYSQSGTRRGELDDNLFENQEFRKNLGLRTPIIEKGPLGSDEDGDRFSIPPPPPPPLTNEQDAGKDGMSDVESDHTVPDQNVEVDHVEIPKVVKPRRQCVNELKALGNNEPLSKRRRKKNDNFKPGCNRSCER